MKSLHSSLLAIAVAVVGLSSSSCTVFQNNRSSYQTAVKSEAVTSQQEPASVVAQELMGDWAIVEVNGQAIVPTGDDEYPRLGFTRNQENAGLIDFYAYNGCNFINGVVALKGASISKQGDFAATMKMCPDAAYEMAISTALEQMRTLKIQKINNESFLYLLNSDGQTVMTLRKHNLNFIEGAWKVTAIDGEKLPQDVDIQMVVDLQTNTVHGNAGCNVLNGTVNINMAVENGIGFSNLRTTRMTCPNIAYESRFLIALEQVAKVSGNARQAQFLDAQGKPLITMTPLSRNDLVAMRY